MYLLDEVTAYTVEHELMHMKLWHKMTKEFPELRDQYLRISPMIHEEYVISEMLKSVKKWDVEDVLSDIKSLNKNFRRPSGLEDVGIDYFKKWNLEDHI